MRAAIYARISSDKTGAGLGVERQEADCRELCAREGWDVTHVLVDNDISAFSGKRRPGYEELLRLIAAGEIDRVVAWHTDRMHRRVRDLLDYVDLIEKTQVKTITVKAGDVDLSTANGITMAQIGGVIAEGYVRSSTEKLRNQKLQQARAGRWSGGLRPFGYSADCSAIREDEAAEYHGMVAKMISGWSFNRVAIELNSRGVLTSQGKTWNALKVNNLLSHKRYIGIREHHGAEYQAQWPAIITKEEFAEMRLAIKQHAAQYKQLGPARRNLLTGFVVCGLCGSKLSSMQRENKVRRYSCRGCWKINRIVEPVDYLVTESILYRLDTDNLAELLASEVSNDNEMKVLVDLRTQHVNKLAALADDYTDELLTRSEYARASQTIKTRLAEVENQISAQTRCTSAGSMIPIGETVRSAWEKNDLRWRRQLVALLIDKVVINPSPGVSNMRKCDRFEGKWRFDPANVEIRWLA